MSRESTWNFVGDKQGGGKEKVIRDYQDYCKVLKFRFIYIELTRVLSMEKGVCVLHITDAWMELEPKEEEK